MTTVAALQSCLAGEHAAIYGYGVVGGALAVTAKASPDVALAQASYDVHRRRRDDLTQLVAALGAEPVAAEPGYAMPFEVVDHNGARRLAREIEHSTAATYSMAVASTTAAMRRFTAEALADCATREVTWGAIPEAFPGINQP
ncbi:MAG: ferritin-like domain-containing protein [Nocardioidaceae bacterium]